MDINDLRSLVTVLAFAMFVGIVAWTYSSKRKQDFDAAAKLDDDEDVAIRQAGADKQYN